MRWVIFILTCLSAAIPCTARVITVDDDGPADFNNIQAAIDDSNDGDIIIVSPGTYTGDGNRDIDYNGKAIIIRSIDPNDPNIVAATIIDCQGSEANPHRGFYFHSGENANSILSGLTITNGYAKYGGGIYCGWHSGPPPGPPPPDYNIADPTITNCTLNGNSAIHGGGIACIRSSPTLTNCTFTDNLALGGGMGGGGGMYNRESSPTLTSCTFNENTAGGGGGMHNHESSPTLINCIFSENSAESAGGLSNHRSNPTLINCTLSGNSAAEGGGMINHESSPTLTNCTFSGNSAAGSGTLWGGGGGMFNYESSPTLKNCTFSGNSASVYGGGMYNLESSPTLKNCTFSRNLAKSGGGMYNKGFFQESSPTLTNCTFSGNSTSTYWQQGYGLGGGMYNERSSPKLTNCLFNGNLAGYLGGGVYNHKISRPILTNCTISGNKNIGQNWSCGHGYGGGMHNGQGCYTTATNCIFWDNGRDGITGNPVDANYSNIEGGWPGEGNIDADPCFVAPGHFEPNCVSGPYYPHCTCDWMRGDYHLLPDSPCIDAGDPNYLAEPNETDLDGRRRIIGGRIDMGAYEYSPPIPAEVRIVPRTINLQSKGKWIIAFLWQPENYNVSDIDPNSVLLEDEIQPDRFSVDEEEQVAIATFRRSDVQAILDIGNIKLTITGQLTDGTAFAATDIIKVLNKARQKSTNQRILY